MTDFATLAAGIAAALSGELRTHDEGGEPIRLVDHAVVNLTGERTGLMVILRKGWVPSESSRIRATMSQTAESRDGAHYSETPDFHTLETAAAMSRSPDAIARQIESKLIAGETGALAMLEAWKVKRREHHATRDRLAASVARWQARFPKARISTGERDYEARFDLSTGHTVQDYAYVSGRITADGSLHIDRMSNVREADAMALVAAHVAGRD